MAAISQLRDLLRPPDDLKFVLEATLVTSSDSNLDTKNRRLLAAVAHKDDWSLTEEGCLLVCKFKSGMNGQPEELEIQKIFPIYGQFSIVISQMRRGTIDLQSTVLEQTRSVITLSVNPAEGLLNDAQAPTFFTYDVQGLKNFVAECKRLKEVSDVETNAVVNLASSTTYFNWVKPYLEKSSTIASLTTTLQDLRMINKPLIERLSPACAGTTGDDHADLQLIRDDWVRVNAREKSSKGRRTLTLRLGTFNVNGKMPSQDLSAWIQGLTNPKRISLTTLLPTPKTVSPFALTEFIRNPFDWASKPKEEEKDPPSQRVDLSNPDDPDMLVLGFQELDLSTEALIYSTRTTREDAWTLAIFAALGEKAVKYEKLVSKQLVGMLLIILVKKNLKTCFGEIKTSAAGAGILGVMGNKGGTAVRLSFTPPFPTSSELSETSTNLLGPTILTFVNAHLAAFDEMADKRNADFQDLSKRLLFENNVVDTDGSEQSEGAANDGSFTLSSRPPVNIYEADALFWMGDLNYRLDLADTPVRRILRDEKWENGAKFEALLRFDQLKKAMKEGKAFNDFKEYPIAHMPSYRFSPGLMMDSLGYDLKRKPAWTDRILHMNSPLCQLDQTSYTSHPEIIMSDHRPVSADFSLTVDAYDTESLQSNIRDLFQSLNHLDGDGTHNRGSLKIEDTYVDFEKISYGARLERKISIVNTNNAPCAFRFVPVQLDSPIHPDWLDINPMMGVLLPNEVTQIVLTAHVDSNDIAAALNLRGSDLSGTLILHTVLGKDHFISVSAEYQYTCFANKLTRLTRLRGPIRSMESPHDLLPENKAINAPREIMRLINWMMCNTANMDRMFLEPGDDNLISSIRESLDTGEEFSYPDNQNPEVSLAFASTLLQFLDSLGEPIISASLHAQCAEMTNRDEAFELLDRLSPVSVNVWISLTAFLHFLCQEVKHNEDHAERIATVLAPVLLRDDPYSLDPPVSPIGKQKFLLYFIT